MKERIKNLKRIVNINIRDIASIFPMIVAIIPSFFLKKRYQNIWMISDRKDEANDNGFCFFKYMRKKHPEQQCVYVIKKSCEDFEKVKDLGKIIEYGSIKHWVLYFTCKYNISSQGGHPNGYLCTFLENISLVHPQNVFLQHGITKDMATYLCADRRKIMYFITGAEPEYRFVKENFGYRTDVIQYTGFARFDYLHERKNDEKFILIMPTWRSWLRLKSERKNGIEGNIEKSEYLKKWNELLNDKRLNKYITEKNLKVIFFPHSNFQKYLNLFNVNNKNIKLASKNEFDVQLLLKKCSLLITDYSSVFFDIAYMKKPIIFYQFDEKQYREYHYQQGWFDYHKTHLGKFCDNQNMVVDELIKSVTNNFKLDDMFEKEHSHIFPKYDKKNCERIYQLLIKNG